MDMTKYFHCMIVLYLHFLNHILLFHDEQLNKLATKDMIYQTNSFETIGPILDDRLKEKNPETLKGCPQ